MLCASAVLMAAVQHAASRGVARRVRVIMAPLHAQWDGIRYHLFTGRVDMRGVTLPRGAAAFRADRISIPGPVSEPVFPGSVTLEIKGASLPVTGDFFGEYAPLFNGLGYNTLHADLKMTVTFNEGTLAVMLHSARIDRLGELSGLVEFDNMSGGFWQSLESIREKELRLRGMLRDDGLAAGIMNFFAAQTSVPLETVKARALDGINRRMQTALREDDTARKKLGQIYRFFDDPRTLIVVIQEDNVTLGELLPPAGGWRETALWFAGAPFEITYSGETDGL